MDLCAQEISNSQVPRRRRHQRRGRKQTFALGVAPEGVGLQLGPLCRGLGVGVSQRAAGEALAAGWETGAGSRSAGSVRSTVGYKGPADCMRGIPIPDIQQRGWGDLVGNRDGTRGPPIEREDGEADELLY